LVVRKDDLIFSRANTTELVGAVCMVRRTPPNVLLPDKLWRIKLRRNAQINPNYLLHFLQLPHSRKTIGGLATGTSGSMKNISKEKTGTIRVLLPPIERQERFAAVVLSNERVRTQQREADRQAEHLFQTLLHRAFAENC
jgi:type I restriction enzyme S subunit